MGATKSESQSSVGEDDEKEEEKGEEEVSRLLSVGLPPFLVSMQDFPVLIVLLVSEFAFFPWFIISSSCFLSQKSDEHISDKDFPVPVGDSSTPTALLSMHRYIADIS